MFPYETFLPILYNPFPSSSTMMSLQNFAKIRLSWYHLWLFVTLFVIEVDCDWIKKISYSSSIIIHVSYFCFIRYMWWLLLNGNNLFGTCVDRSLMATTYLKIISSENNYVINSVHYYLSFPKDGLVIFCSSKAKDALVMAHCITQILCNCVEIFIDNKSKTFMSFWFPTKWALKLLFIMRKSTSYQKYL